MGIFRHRILSNKRGGERRRRAGDKADGGADAKAREKNSPFSLDSVYYLHECGFPSKLKIRKNREKEGEQQPKIKNKNTPLCGSGNMYNKKKGNSDKPNSPTVKYRTKIDLEINYAEETR